MNQKELRDAIRNDLRRVANFGVRFDTELTSPQFNSFISHAKKLTADYEGSKYIDSLRNELDQLDADRAIIEDPLSRLRWSEKILTLSCRL